MQTGPRNLITDVDGLYVGNAQDAQVKTGTTVLTADHPFTAGVHVMGGAPGTTETDLLAPDRLIQEVDALVLSGGSALGLAAADGVRTALRARGRGFMVQDQHVPIVAGAILMDLNKYQALKMEPKSIKGAEYLFVEAGGFSARHKPGWKPRWLVLARP